MFVLADYIIFFMVCLFDSDNGKEFITTIVVDLLKASNLNCFIVMGRSRTPRDQGSVESANKVVRQVLKSISLENRLRSIKVNWTKLLGQVMAVCNSHSGIRKHSVLSYEAVFGQKYHTQLKCNVSEMCKCRSIFQRLKLSPNERLETYVRQHDIVNIEINDSEFDDNDNVDDSDKDEGVDIDDNAFLELILEEEDMQLGKHDSNDGLGNTRVLDSDGDVDDGEEHYKELPSMVEDADNIDEVLVGNTPPFVVDPPPVYCQITSDYPPPVVNEPTEPTTFCVREYSTFTVQEAWDHGNIARYHQPLGTRDEFQFLWPTLIRRDCCFPHGVPYIQIGNDDYISSMTNTTNWNNGVFISSFSQIGRALRAHHL